MMGNFLNIKTTKEGYEYAERKGKDSVAFILFDRNKQMIGLRNEYKPPIEAYVLGAFGGSMDKDVSPATIVLEEVFEESGYHVSLDNIHFIGKYFVSTQMNQWCYLYAVDTTHATNPRDSIYPGKVFDKLEAVSDVSWHKYGFLPPECWKTTCILRGMVQQRLGNKYGSVQ